MIELLCQPEKQITCNFKIPSEYYLEITDEIRFNNSSI